MLNYLSIILVLAGSAILIRSYPEALKISKTVTEKTRRQWKTIVYLICLFVAGYILFSIILLLNFSFPLELVTGCVFFFGAVFVFIMTNLSRSTIDNLKKIDEELLERTSYARIGADIGSAFVSNNPIETQLEACTKSIAENINAVYVGILLLENENSKLEPIAESCNDIYSENDCALDKIDETQITSVLKGKKPCLINSLMGSKVLCDREWAQRYGITSFAGYPFIIAGKVTGIMIIFSDKYLNETGFNYLGSISNEIALGIERTKAEEKIHTLAYYDSLTKLPNRYLFRELLARSLEYAKRYNHAYTVMMIDLDNFSRINDTLGHDVGDELLQLVSSRLVNVLRSSDFIARIDGDEHSVARMGGDEFIVLLQDLDDTSHTGNIVRRILEDLTRAYDLRGHEIFITVSIGIVVFPDNGNDVDTLIKNADTALNHAKKNGKNNFRFYSESMNKTSFNLLTMEANLHRAIEREEFLLYYQPKVDIISKKIVGAEALIRWKTSDGVLVSPADFIPVAEKNGLIVPIGDFVLKEACRQNKQWQDTEADKISVAINVAGLQFEKKNFIGKVYSALDETGLAPEYLNIEITETMIMNNPQKAIEILNELKKTGIGISMDDFGTGYSSLNYLQKLPLDVLKIDGSFIRDVTVNPNDAAIVKAIIAMAKSLKLEVVAEGVEDKEQLEFLEKHGCEIIQGYFFSKPLPADDFYTLLTNWDYD